jgi:hypothetical protein
MSPELDERRYMLVRGNRSTPMPDALSFRGAQQMHTDATTG